MDINREGCLVELLHEDKISSEAGFCAIQGRWVEKGGRCGVHFVFALIEEILLGIILVTLVHIVGQEVVGSVCH